MSNPIPHPDNILGKSVLPAETEDRLLADGMRFATVLLSAGQKDRAGHTRKRPLILCGRRCPVQAGQAGLRDWFSVVGAGAEQRAVA